MPMADSPLAAVTAAAGAVTRDVAGWAMPAHYGDSLAEYRAAVESAALFDVSHRGKLELTGPDAPSFLHNLCTNDVKELPLGAGCEAFFTTAKAKVIGHALIYHARLDGGRDALLLDVEPGKAEPLLKHLDRYLIAEQVEMADRTADYAQIHLAGPQAKAVLERALGDDVPDLDELEHMERTFGLSATCHIRRHGPLGLPGYDVVCLHDRAEGVWRMLTAAGAKPAGLDASEMLRVEAGTPVDGRDFDENRFVVEVGRGARAISYTKGCYLGQEPIVMARDRAGHVNRTLLGLVLTDGGGPVPAGAKVFRGDAEVGVVSSSAASPRAGGAVALAYLRRGNQDPGTEVTVETPEGRRPAAVRALPIVS
jgi:folate-binding protein YgfZ